MQKVINICDRCGYSNEKGEERQMWTIYVKYLSGIHSHYSNPIVDTAAQAHWCRECMNSFGGIFKTKEDLPLHPETKPTLEDYIREIIHEEMNG